MLPGVVQAMPVSEALGWAAVADLARLATAGLYALVLWLIRGAFSDLKELRKDHVKLDRRVSRLEGANGVELQPETD